MNITEWESWLGPTIRSNISVVESYLKKGDVFVDVGANTGLFTKIIIDDLGVDYLSTIILFEPIPHLVEECRKKFGGMSNVIINELALSNKEEDATMIASSQNLGYNKIYKDGMEMPTHEKFVVKCVTFRDWMTQNNIDKVDFVKIDAEGHDVHVIEGMFEWLEQTGNRPYILFESRWYPDLEQALVNHMSNAFNYNIVTLERDTLLVP